MTMPDAVTRRLRRVAVAAMHDPGNAVLAGAATRQRGWTALIGVARAVPAGLVLDGAADLARRLRRRPGATGHAAPAHSARPLADADVDTDVDAITPHSPPPPAPLPLPARSPPRPALMGRIAQARQAGRARP